MNDMPWRDAIIRVLDEHTGALHYVDIAEQIVKKGLRVNVGATPQATANATVSNSIKREGESSPFVRVNVGEYILRKYAERPSDVLTKLDEHSAAETEAVEEDKRLVHAFGMFWQRDSVYWTNSPSILGRQQIGATEVDFSPQRGVYLLHDGREVIYVGRSTDRPLGQRLFEHTHDRLRTRWNRFSWFGLLKVAENGTLDSVPFPPSAELVAATLEALLIEGLEPRQNRRRGDGFTAVEYLQAEDPEIERQKMKRLLGIMQDKLVT